jgi:hypothetical protein
MRPPRRNLSKTVAALLLLAGMFTPMVVLGQMGTSAQTQSSLTTLLSAAETSRSYASSAVGLAESHGLSVSVAQIQLTQGDSLLAAAQADAQSGSSLAAGVQAAHEAMDDYTSAATVASTSLTNAGLTAPVAYSAATGAVAQINSTVSFMAAVSATACGTGNGAGSNGNAVATACADLKAQLTSASANLKEASAMLVQANGQTNAVASISQAMSLVQLARSEVETGQTDITTLASYTYTQRGQAYLAAFVLPISARANATIKSELSFLADIEKFGNSLSAYSISQTSAAANASESIRLLATAISQVGTGSPSLAISAAQSTAAQVSSNMSSLLTLVSSLNVTPLVTALTNDINACSASTHPYNSALAAASVSNGAFISTKLQAFSGYLDTMESAASTVQSDGTSYVTACGSVQTALTALIDEGGLLPPLLTQLDAYATALASLVAATVSTSGRVNSSLQLETSEMATVQSEILPTTMAVKASMARIFVNGSLVATGSFFPVEEIEEGVMLNATASAAVAGIGASVQEATRWIPEFVSFANSTLGDTIGSLQTDAGSLGSVAAALSNQFQASTTSCSTARAYVMSDTAARTSEAAAGHAEVVTAMQLLASLNISGGAEALAQASLDFRLAASEGA